MRTVPAVFPCPVCREDVTERVHAKLLAESQPVYRLAGRLRGRKRRRPGPRSFTVKVTCANGDTERYSGTYQ